MQTLTAIYDVSRAVLRATYDVSRAILAARYDVSRAALTAIYDDLSYDGTQLDFSYAENSGHAGGTV